MQMDDIINHHNTNKPTNICNVNCYIQRKPDEVQVLYNEEEEKEEEEPDMPYLTPITETPPEKENLHPPPPVVKKIIYPVKVLFVHSSKLQAFI